jgi:Derlin-2/3
MRRLLRISVYCITLVQWMIVLPGIAIVQSSLLPSSLSLHSSITRWLPNDIHRRHSPRGERVGTVVIPELEDSLCTIRSWLQVRGGALVDDDEEDEEEEFLDAGLDDDDFEMTEADFTEDATIDCMRTAWRKTPPLTKGYLSASMAATLYGYLFHKNEFPPALTLDWQPILYKLQWWRPLTAFLNFGPLGLGYLMTAHFVWTYMATLERLNYAKPYDFWIMILFGQLSMVIGYPVLKLSPRFLGHNLSTFLVYIWSRYHEGIEVNMFELFNTRAELLPWFFLAQTFLLEGELPVLDFLGIVFGHIYHHCKTVGILRAPDSLVAWYRGDSSMAQRIRDLYKPISSDFEV